MKDYRKIAERISKMGIFSAIYNCGDPTKDYPVNLYCRLNEAYVIGYGFYVAYSRNGWNVDYTLDNSIQMRTDMQTVRGIKTDTEMYRKVEEIIHEIRRKCGVY